MVFKKFVIATLAVSSVGFGSTNPVKTVDNSGLVAQAIQMLGVEQELSEPRTLFFMGHSAKGGACVVKVAKDYTGSLVSELTDLTPGVEDGGHMGFDIFSKRGPVASFSAQLNGNVVEMTSLNRDVQSRLSVTVDMSKIGSERLSGVHFNTHYGRVDRSGSCEGLAEVTRMSDVQMEEKLATAVAILRSHDTDFVLGEALTPSSFDCDLEILNGSRSLKCTAQYLGDRATDTLMFKVELEGEALGRVKNVSFEVGC